MRSVSFGLVRLTGNPFYRVITLAKPFTHNLNNIVCVAVCFGKDKRFGTSLRLGNKFVNNFFFELRIIVPDLARIDNAPVVLTLRIVNIFTNCCQRFALESLSLHSICCSYSAPFLVISVSIRKNIFTNVNTITIACSLEYSQNILIEKRKGSLCRSSS